MEGQNNKLSQRYSSRILVIAILVFANTIAYAFFQTREVYAMPPGGCSIWSDVIVMGDERQWDHINPVVPCIVGVGCTEAGYYDPEYTYYTTTKVTAPDGSFSMLTSNYDQTCATTHVYVQMQGAVGRYNIDTDHYSVSNSTWGEEYLGCTHTYADTNPTSELYYKFAISRVVGSPPVKYCFFDNCPGNVGKTCYNSAQAAERWSPDSPCPGGILNVTQKTRMPWTPFTKCVIISHLDFSGQFDCP